MMLSLRSRYLEIKYVHCENCEYFCCFETQGKSSLFPLPRYDVTSPSQNCFEATVFLEALPDPCSLYLYIDINNFSTMGAYQLLGNIPFRREKTANGKLLQSQTNLQREGSRKPEGPTIAASLMNVVEPHNCASHWAKLQMASKHITHPYANVITLLHNVVVTSAQLSFYCDERKGVRMRV